MGKIAYFFKKNPTDAPSFPGLFLFQEKMSEFGLTDGTLAPVIPVIKLLAWDRASVLFFPLLRCGTSFHRALGEGSSPPEVP